MRRSFSTLLIVAFFAIQMIIPAQKLPRGISIYQLDNGIEVMLIEKPSLPMVGINTVVKVGSAYESFATSGMSHMLEHLLFNGTTTMKQKALYDATDKIGGYNNANTSEYYTNFMMVTPAENIEQGMKLQAAMLFDSVLPEEKFEKEKGIVLEEIAKSLADSREQIERNTISIIYKGHALSLPTLGTYETIKNMSRDEVYAFYKNYYVPNNMIISVIGNFKTDEMLDMLKSIYGTHSPGTVELPVNSQLSAGFDSLPGLGSAVKTFHRFYKGKSLLMQVFFRLDQPQNYEFFQLLDLSLSGKADSIKKELNAKFDSEISELEFGTRISPVVNYLEANLTLTDADRAEEITNKLTSILSDLDYSVDPGVVMSESIKAATQFLKNTEKPHMFGIYNAHLFAEYGVESILAKYSGNGFSAAAEGLRSFKPLGNPIIIIQHPAAEDFSETDQLNSGPALYQNSNGGADVIVKQSSGSGLLAVHYLMKHKSKLESEFGKDAAYILHDAFGQRMKSAEVQNESAKYGFSFTVNDNPFIPMDNIYLDPSFGYLRAEALAFDVKGAVGFLNDQLLNFVPTESEFQKAAGSLSRVKMMSGRNPVKSKYTGIRDSLLFGKSEPSEAGELTYDKLLEFSAAYFAPSNIIISIVSPENGETVNSYFTEFKIDSPQKTGNPNFKKFSAIEETKVIDIAGGGAQSYLYFGFQKNVDPAEAPVLKALSLLLSDKIIFDIREKQGMAYRMSAGIDQINDKAMFYIDMATRPENVDLLLPQFPEFFSVEFADSIKEDELTRSVNMYLGRMMFRRLSSINQAYYLAHSLYFHDDINYDADFWEKLKKVTLEEVRSAARKYLNYEDYVEIIVR